ncbi:MAG: hypothetical protein QOG83_2266 [Alphaproteobacteria bacterium]|nr:hypothetical protein [Alphaproteobacteria bacterium]
MSTRKDRVEPDYPRSRPEIIPSERGGAGPKSHIWIWTADRDGARRVVLNTPGPFTILLALALAGLVVAVILIVALGAILLWIPFLILAIGGLLLATGARQYWQRLQRWMSRR